MNKDGWSNIETNEVDYVPQMKKAMIKLHEACSNNQMWCNCYRCPFTEYCDYILEHTSITPDDKEFIEFEEGE